MNKLKKLMLWIGVFGAFSGHTEIDYPAVAAQPSFKSVTELPYNQNYLKIPYGNDVLQYGLLWHSSQANQLPLIVMVHGGCWLNAFGVDHTFAMATALAQQGFSVWSLEYRRTGDNGGGWPGSFNDIKLALTNLSNLKQHNINTDHVVLMGHSAGGHLALLAASELTDTRIKKVIGLAAITDISRYALGDNSCQQATPKFMNGMPNEIPTAYQQASLIYRQLPKQTILMQGTADNIVPAIQAKLSGVEAISVDDAGHFDWVHPGSPAFKALLNELITFKKNLK